MMKVSGHVVYGDPPSDPHRYPDIQEANQYIAELEERILNMEEAIEQAELRGELYKKEIRALKILVDTQTSQIKELIQINDEHRQQFTLLMQEIRKERATSYYQMITSAISTAACVITLYLGIKRIIPPNVSLGLKR